MEMKQRIPAENGIRSRVAMKRFKLIFEHYTNPLTFFVMLRKCGMGQRPALRLAGIYEKLRTIDFP